MPANTDTRYQSLSAASYAISSILIILITICFVVKVSSFEGKADVGMGQHSRLCHLLSASGSLNRVCSL
jgi:hypothetical protein